MRCLVNMLHSLGETEAAVITQSCSACWSPEQHSEMMPKWVRGDHWLGNSTEVEMELEYKSTANPGGLSLLH